LFAGSHLLTEQNPENECYVIDWFIGTIVEWSEYWCSWMAAHHKEQYREFALDEVATWVSKHSVQKTSTAAFEQILLTEFCQYDTLATLQNSVYFQSFICPRENVVLC